MPDLGDLASKLAAPGKKSLFERQKAEAEAKRAREEEETAAVLEDFVKSFDDEAGRPPPPPPPSSSTGARAAPPGTVGKRHFTGSGLKSGPGSLGPAPSPKSGPGSLGPAPSRKRQHDEYRDRPDRGRFSYQDERRTNATEGDREDEKAAAKPTLHLSSMPPGTSPAVIKGLLTPSPLVVENVRILPPASASGPATERKSTAAIVTLAADTPATDIDTIVSQLQNKYLGVGFKLSISRHLSSAAVNLSSVPTSNVNTLPFGARPVPQHTSLSRAPPPGHRFAPPASYTSSTPYSRGPPTQVNVQAPSDLKQIKLIHKMLEALLTYGPEFEALVMSRPEIQRDEKWAWLWDSRSAGGVYYRWRLWEILTNVTGRSARRGRTPEAVFEGQSLWIPPEESLRFEYVTNMDEFVSDDDYNSSDEEEDEGGLARRYNDHSTTALAPEELNDGAGYLDPLAKTKLVHLLSRLPESIAKLRRGDVARITAFAIEHAGAGGEEVAALCVRNVIKPFQKIEDEDTTSASMVGLYAISDILSASASAGVRHAWRYRTLFENALRRQNVFEQLGRAEKDYRWGKLKAEKWKRSVQTLLHLWEGWSVFPQSSQEEFTNLFLNPPLTPEEQKAAEAEQQRKVDDELQRSKSATRWRSVEEEGSGDILMRDVDPGDNIDGSAMTGDDSDENLDGVTLADSSDEEMAEAEAEPDTVEVVASSTVDTSAPQAQESPSAPSSGRKQRPRAVDMFADDSE